MKLRRHHNNDGRQQIRRYRTRQQMRRLAYRLRIPYGRWPAAPVASPEE